MRVRAVLWVQEGSELFVSCLLNRAACYLKMERYGNTHRHPIYASYFDRVHLRIVCLELTGLAAAVGSGSAAKDCSAVIALKPQSVKAWYRRCAPDNMPCHSSFRR